MTKHEPLGLYVYPVVMLAALAGFVGFLYSGMFGHITGAHALAGGLISLLFGWGAATRFDRLESRMGGAE